ncbi:hypothetical protein EJ419_04520 [Alloscardovia theropitheci]|uniref:Uncharacterized protein n=1 Tax=Alloscardovia theropitheci TaxID=2496842 RepID=A0A4R0QSY7_9BIFI|nr:hypothetical protein [Alloscardovia theropitheci]TCD54305.1 hypothetical protein EJ419_04520 [Alloscardovia theropitheci]
MNLAMIIISGIIGLLAGILFGAFPLRTSSMTSKQQSYSSALSLLTFGIFIVLILLNLNTESYVFIGAVLIGFGVAKIPPIHNLFVENFKIFKPKKSSKERK